MPRSWKRFCLGGSRSARGYFFDRRSSLAQSWRERGEFFDGEFRGGFFWAGGVAESTLRSCGAHVFGRRSHATFRWDAHKSLLLRCNSARRARGASKLAFRRCVSASPVCMSVQRAYIFVMAMQRRARDAQRVYIFVTAVHIGCAVRLFITAMCAPSFCETHYHRARLAQRAQQCHGDVMACAGGTARRN